MGFWDKLRNKTQRAKGHGKERVGRETGDPYLEAEGRAERVKGGAKQVGEQVKDAGEEIRKSVD